MTSTVSEAGKRLFTTVSLCVCFQRQDGLRFRVASVATAMQHEPPPSQQHAELVELAAAKVEAASRSGNAKRWWRAKRELWAARRAAAQDAAATQLQAAARGRFVRSAGAAEAATPTPPHHTQLPRLFSPRAAQLPPLSPHHPPSLSLSPLPPPSLPPSQPAFQPSPWSRQPTPAEPLGVREEPLTASIDTSLTREPSSASSPARRTVSGLPDLSGLQRKLLYGAFASSEEQMRSVSRLSSAHSPPRARSPTSEGPSGVGGSPPGARPDERPWPPHYSGYRPVVNSPHAPAAFPAFQPNLPRSISTDFHIPLKASRQEWSRRIQGHMVDYSNMREVSPRAQCARARRRPYASPT